MPSSGRLQLILRALKRRNYRLFFVGQGVSLGGSWMQQVALAWRVYRLTDSSFLLGMLVPRTSRNTLLHTLAEEGKRGRAMRLCTLSCMGGLPWGNFGRGVGRPPGRHRRGPLGRDGLSGRRAGVPGLPAPFRAQVRPLYAATGILRERAAALEMTDEPGTGEQR
jgi:hypothetical protein